MNRKDFIKRSLLGTAGVSVLNQPFRAFATHHKLAAGELGNFDPVDNVRIGVVGVGNRGDSLLKQVLRLENCQVTGVCDLIEARVERGQRWVTEAGQDKPKGYSRGEYDYRRMYEDGNCDLILVMTPWEWHGPMCIDSMKAGIHCATEVPGVQTIDECWELVELSEKTGKHCMLLENYCYTREIMTVYNLVQQGLFGDPLHIYAGYQKEALYYNFNTDGSLSCSGKGGVDHWGNVYASHFAGPSAQWLGINRGDAFDYLVSMGVWGRSYQVYAKRFFGDDHPFAKNPPKMADVSNTMIATKNGKSLSLIHDTRLPRPLRHYFRLQATNGIYENIEERVHIGDHSPGDWSVPRGLVDQKTGERSKGDYRRREWEPISNYYEEYQHIDWKEKGDMAKSSGHGGGDFIMLYRMVKSINRGDYPDIDVYDLGAWSCILEASEESARNRSKAVDVPDFPRGKWKHRKPLATYLT